MNEPSGDIPPGIAALAEYESRETERRSRESSRRLTKWGAIVTLTTAASSAGALLIATLGFRMIGPPHELRLLKEQAEEARAVAASRFAVTSTRIDSTMMRIDSLADAVRMQQSEDEFQTYLLCTILRRSDPNAVPGRCNSGSTLTGRRP